MSYVFETNDCRGLRVVCTEEIWYGKILMSRPWMDGWQDMVREALEKPSFICGDATHNNRHVYYSLHATKHNRYIKVVAKFNSDNEGFVISAFPADSGKQNEKVIWP